MISTGDEDQAKSGGCTRGPLGDAKPGRASLFPEDPVEVSLALRSLMLQGGSIAWLRGARTGD